MSTQQETPETPDNPDLDELAEKYRDVLESLTDSENDRVRAFANAILEGGGR